VLPIAFREIGLLSFPFGSGICAAAPDYDPSYPVANCGADYNQGMKRISAEQIKVILADIDTRLRAGEELSTEDIEEPLKNTGHSYQWAKDMIIKYGSPLVQKKYKESFHGMAPSELDDIA
jgi:hypothetical protein